MASLTNSFSKKYYAVFWLKKIFKKNSQKKKDLGILLSNNIYEEAKKVKKYPFEKQEESKDCGVSCLSMIIRFYKGYIPKYDLLDMTKTNRNGTTAYHLVQTLKDIGFESYGVECKFKDFCMEQISLPLISNVIIDKSSES